MTETQILTIASRRLALARRITPAAALEVLQANPDVLGLLRIEITALTPEQLAHEEYLDSPDAANPTTPTRSPV